MMMTALLLASAVAAARASDHNLRVVDAAEASWRGAVGIDGSPPGFYLLTKCFESFGRAVLGPL